MRFGTANKEWSMCCLLLLMYLVSKMSHSFSYRAKQCLKSKKNTDMLRMNIMCLYWDPKEARRCSCTSSQFHSGDRYCLDNYLCIAGFRLRPREEQWMDNKYFQQFGPHISEGRYMHWNLDTICTCNWLSLKCPRKSLWMSNLLRLSLSCHKRRCIDRNFSG